MIYNPQIHHRHSIRLPEYDYNYPGYYFITIDTWNKECLFGSVLNGEIKLNEYGRIVKEWWLKIPNKYQNLELDEFNILPNHIHGIIVITVKARAGFVETTVCDKKNVGAIHELPLPNATTQFAGKTTQREPVEHMKKRRQMLLSKVIGYYKMNSTKRINELRSSPGAKVWHRNYYEHIIRDDKELFNIRNYIKYNASKWDQYDNIENKSIC